MNVTYPAAPPEFEVVTLASLVKLGVSQLLGVLLPGTSEVGSPLLLDPLNVTQAPFTPSPVPLSVTLTVTVSGLLSLSVASGRSTHVRLTAVTGVFWKWLLYFVAVPVASGRPHKFALV